MGTLKTLLLGHGQGVEEERLWGWCQLCSCLTHSRRARGLALAWLCMETKTQSLSPCPADAFLLFGGWFDSNTEVFSLQRITGPALNVCWGSQPGLVAPSPARRSLALGYLVRIVPYLDALPPASHSTHSSSSSHHKTKHIPTDMKGQDLICVS